ncbi:hypothetical protein AFV1_ORF150 [Captovirus AFV1]|uniref:Uncharacterized protein ORF150 n=1 Tax=Acidianus filamentous virus 1 (isolate United States/Yellowstone) TaxID=654909 RepID=Y150_AFV1Y|nr:hypothetical protein AFV1_ORF150 [Captovirus AFV1]Q70LF0.1 RecName: Full=Uncharacterized protein ORF150 [Acidianus filamentous virus 1 (isolate Yellowstone)]CAD98930.1 hypothetical protein [Captovirus AFV1]
MSEDLTFEERYQKDIRRRESFFSDFHLTDYSNYLGMKDTDELQTKGYVVYIADGYITEYILRYFDKQYAVIDDYLYYVLIVKFMGGFKVFIYEYSYGKLLESDLSDYSIFEKSIADINSLISSCYHIALSLSHTFFNITEYYTKYISNFK